MKENAAQEKAIETIYGPVIIISCPGSGKTTTLIRRIHRMIDEGINAQNILMVTFTKKAAEEMGERYKKLYGCNPGVTFVTIHSLCYRILITEGMHRPEDVLTPQTTRDFVFKRLLKKGQSNDAWELSMSIVTEISSVRNNYIDINTYEPDSCDRDIFMDIYREYEAAKKAYNRFDYDDMLLETKELLSDPAVAKRWQDQFQYIQCDEYQDTNFIQRDILYILAGDKANLCVVGDDDQSIYGFRGARIETILSFEKDYENCVKIMMSTNYRSAQKVVDWSDLLIKLNTKRYEKDFVSERGKDGAKGDVVYTKSMSRKMEIERVIEQIKKRHEEGVPYKEMAILFRENKQAQAPVRALSEANIPFNSTEKVKSIYDDWMFKDIRMYIELSAGIQGHEAMMHLLNRPSRYLKSEPFKNAGFNTRDMIDAIQYLRTSVKNEYWRYQAAEKSIYAWIDSFGPGKVTLDSDPKLLRNKLCGKNGIRYDRYVAQFAESRKLDVGEMLDELETLLRDAARFETIREWFDHARAAVFQTNEDNRKQDKEGVVVTTMHKSKGLEWDTVFVIDVNDGVVPHKKSAKEKPKLEEERRLLYVAMTRAKNNLQIHTSGAESVFVKELLQAVEEKEHPFVPKKLAGSPVNHKTFGKGKVVSYTKDKIKVRFEDKERLFPFPDSFLNGFLAYC